MDWGMDANQNSNAGKSTRSLILVIRRMSALIAVLICSAGCMGCQRPIVPPPAAIGRSQPQAPIVDQQPILEPPALNVPAPQESELAPVTPIAKDNPWKPETSARDWKYIVLHHTASEQGDVASIHESHLKNKDKNGNPWLGIGYHFVIGNGRGMSDGEIEATFRWKKQMQGAHAGIAEYNQHGIGIVLVGNFEEKAPTEAQIVSLKRLVKVLMRDYEIGATEIVGHSDVKPTECPGNHFPVRELRNSIADLEPDKPLAVVLPLGAGRPSR